MTDILLAAILFIQVLILIQGTRFGDELGRRINRAIYNHRVKEQDDGS